MALADDDECQVGERRQVAAGADAALLRNRRHDAAVVDRQERVDQFGRHAGIPLGQRLDAQGEREPGDAERQQVAHADGVTAQQVLLQREHFVSGMR